VSQEADICLSALLHMLAYSRIASTEAAIYLYPQCIIHIHRVHS